MTQVKICGMTRRKDIQKAVELRVDALGFILAESPRRVSLKQVKKLTGDLPPFIDQVGVVVDPDSDFLKRILEAQLFDCLQFHGREDPEILATCPIKTIKAVSISGRKDLKAVGKYRNHTDYFLFDTRADGKKGGTGKVFNWDYLKEIDSDVPFILAGGLGPENVVSAIREVNPAAVDLNSRLENAPGKKNSTLMKKAVKLVHSV